MLRTSRQTGTKTVRVRASWRIFSWGTDRPPATPMRFAGTIREYSKKASPQLASTATHQADALRRPRCEYQARFMKKLEAVSRPMVWKRARRSMKR